MKKVELKEKDSLPGKLLRRLLVASRGFQASVNLQERDVHVVVPVSSYYDYQNEIRTALLEAERKKAEVLQHLRRRIVC